MGALVHPPLHSHSLSACIDCFNSKGGFLIESLGIFVCVRIQKEIVGASPKNTNLSLKCTAQLERRKQTFSSLGGLIGRLQDDASSTLDQR